MRGYDPGVVHPDPEHSGSRDRIRVPLDLLPPQLPAGVVLPNGVLVGPWGGGGFPTGTGPLGSIKDLFGGADPRDLPDPWDPKSGRERGRPTVKPGSSRGRDATHGIGMFGKEKNPVVDAMLDWIAHSHDLPGFDPTGGYGRKRGPVHPDFGVREIGKKEVIQRIIDSGHQNDPRRRDPRVGGPHVDWWGEERPVSPEDANREPETAPKKPPGATDAQALAFGAVVGAVVVGVGSALFTVYVAKEPLAAPAAAGNGAVVGALLGGLAAISINRLWQQFHRPSDDDSSGVGGPRSNPSQFSGYLNFLPDPESGGPGNPRSRQGSWGVAYMPSPDDSGSGNPRSSLYRPDPETAGPGNPHSRGAQA